MKRRCYKLFCVVLVFFVFGVFLLQNPKFLVGNAWFQGVYDYVEYQVMSHQHSMTLLPNQDRCVNSLLEHHLTVLDIAKLKANKVNVLTATEATAAVAHGKTAEHGFLVIANTPYDFQGKTTVQQLKLLEQSTQAAQKMGAKLVIDASIPDALRVTKQGFTTLQSLKKAGIMRMVVFDGGHHLLTIALDPELVVMPVTEAQDGRCYVNHAYTRDAMPETMVAEIAKELKVNTVLFEVPRLTSAVKTKHAMAELARQALLAVGAQKDVVAVLSSAMVTVYDLASVETGPRVVRAADGTILMSIQLNGETDPLAVVKQVNTNLAMFKGKIAHVYISVLYGDSTFRALTKKMMNPVALNTALQRFTDGRGIRAEIINIPYSSWDLYCSKIINYWQGISTGLLIPKAWI